MLTMFGATPRSANDVPVIGVKALIVMHVVLVLFILFVHWKLSALTDF